MNLQTFSDLFSVGLHPLPLLWDEKTKLATVYPEHITDVQSGNGKHDINDVIRWLDKIKNANAMALKLHPPFFMFDFDLKNTDNKNVFHHWANAVQNVSDTAFGKLCIEQTRSGGYHAYGKYAGVTHKIGLASSQAGSEVIAVYTGGLLSFCYPTPGYTLMQNDFSDIEELTDEEYEIMVAAAQSLNEYHPKENEYVPGEKLSYPGEYESMAIQFDIACTDDLWENLLNSIELYPIPGNRNKKKKFNIDYFLYLREGSTAAFSAKVRFDRKRLFIFSGSYKNFPNFHTKIDSKDTTWHLTPTKLIYYREGKDWIKTMQLIRQHACEFNLTITEPRSVSDQPLVKDRNEFPYDIFPDSIQHFIRYQVIQHEYLAGAALVACSTIIGNTCWLEAMQGYIVKPILYMGVVAPPGASKTPALSKAFKPLEAIDKKNYASYALDMQDYNAAHALWETDKKNKEKPIEPKLKQTLIKDSTIEMVVDILSKNANGCCILADELVGFLNRMNQYKNGDELQKWLELWSGNPLLLQRITRGTTRLEDPYCSIMGGIQDGVLEMMSSEQNQHNGFYHRFLFIYPEPQQKVPWTSLNIPYHILTEYNKLFEHLSFSDQLIYTLSKPGNELYKQWFDKKNGYYNRAQGDHIKGIISKYQDYCLRFALIIEVINYAPIRHGEVSAQSIEKAIRLTEYFLGNMHKALKILTPETPLDKLSIQWVKLYEALPVEFEPKELGVIAETLGTKSNSARTFLLRNEGKLFKRVDRSKWEKLY